MYNTIIVFSIIISTFSIIFVLSRKDFFKERKSKLPFEYIKGMKYILSEEPDKALDTFLSVIDLDQDTIETHMILGNLFRNRGEVNRAIRIHQNLIARPELDNLVKQDCLLELAKDYLKAGLFDRAENILIDLSNKNLSDKDYEMVCRNLIHLYELEKDWEKAITTSIKVQSLTKQDHYSEVISQYYCELAEINLSQAGEDNFENARKNILQAIKYDKNCVRAQILMGDIYAKNEEYKKSIDQYVAVCEKSPEILYMVYEKLKESYSRINKSESFFKYMTNFINHSSFSYLNEMKNIGISKSELEGLYDKAFNEGAVSFVTLDNYLDLIANNEIAYDNESLSNIRNCIKKYIEHDSHHKCSNCGFISTQHFWQCPSCNRWSSIKKSNLKDFIDSSTYVVKK